jgi:nitrate/TMAO reductase-like tetraheme cytochrome c subunit
MRERERGRVRRIRSLLPVVLVFGLAVGPNASTTAAQVENQEPSVVTCNTCHGDPDFLVGKGSPDRQAALLVPDSALLDTVHRELACADCHPGPAMGYPHGPLAAVSCGTCHQSEQTDWEVSVHALNVVESGDAPTCVGCHGTHEVYSIDDRRAPTYPLNVATLCGRCHADPRIIGTYFSAPEEAQARVAVEQYHQTVHGVALEEAGLVISATCNDCHQSHRVLPAESPESSVNRVNVVETCGVCHVGVLETYEEGSAHGEAYRAHLRTPTGYEAPACVDCHSAHRIVEADEPKWFLGVVEECGKCHQDVYETYFSTYHGQVTQLGFELTAKCSDCHTPHNMRPASDPESTVHPLNLVSTCAKCHPAANQNFVRYYAHGDTRDRERYPVLFWSWLFMTTLLVSVWSFFGLHSVLWLVRLAVERVRGGSAGHGT